MQKTNWNAESIHDYWKVTATGKHVVQFYESLDTLIDSLEGFARSGLNAGESVILIARAEVHSKVRERLETLGFDTGALRFDNRLILLNAFDTLSSFMINGEPDQTLFNAKINAVFDLAQGKDNRKVRAFGEMVSLLWQDNNKSATMALELLWNEFCAENPLTLFCAYPSEVLNNDADRPAICFCHEHLLKGDDSLQYNVKFAQT
jgi:hypothetical protein